MAYGLLGRIVHFPVLRGATGLSPGARIASSYLVGLEVWRDAGQRAPGEGDTVVWIPLPSTAGLATVDTEFGALDLDIRSADRPEDAGKLQIYTRHHSPLSIGFVLGGAERPPGRFVNYLPSPAASKKERQAQQRPVTLTRLPQLGVRDFHGSAAWLTLSKSGRPPVRKKFLEVVPEDAEQPTVYHPLLSGTETRLVYVLPGFCAKMIMQTMPSSRQGIVFADRPAEKIDFRLGGGAVISSLKWALEGGINPEETALLREDGWSM